MHVKACYIYPLKSGRSLAVSSLEMTPAGPAHDRLWMVTREDALKGAVLVSQRDRGCGKLALIESVLTPDGGIALTAPGKKPLVLSGQALSSSSCSVGIHGDSAQVSDAGPDAAVWISDYLGQPCRLVRQDDKILRPVDPAYARQGDRVSLADGFPLLITTEASLQKLQENLPPGVFVGMERFRPNIVLAGAQPFEEDILYEIRIGDTVLELVKPCGRCIMTTVDQDLGRTAGPEPVATLARVRRGKAEGLQGVFFGQNAVPRTLGTIRAGDPVEILSRKPMHPAVAQAVLKYEI